MCRLNLLYGDALPRDSNPHTPSSTGSCVIPLQLTAHWSTFQSPTLLASGRSIWQSSSCLGYFYGGRWGWRGGGGAIGRSEYSSGISRYNQNPPRSETVNPASPSAGCYPNPGSFSLMLRLLCFIYIYLYIYIHTSASETFGRRRFGGQLPWRPRRRRPRGTAGGGHDVCRRCMRVHFLYGFNYRTEKHRQACLFCRVVYTEAWLAPHTHTHTHTHIALS